jgi:hypothetical protein
MLAGGRRWRKEKMKDILDKLSSYNIFNNLFPGVIFVSLAKVFLRHSFIQEDVIVGIFLYYFIGMVISRLGSLLIEPILKWTTFVHFAEYKDFVSASQKDVKLEIQSEVNNTYRTLCALFLTLIAIRGYEAIEDLLPMIKTATPFAVILFLLLLFLWSYRKQTSYIAKRIQSQR